MLLNSLISEIRYGLKQWRASNCSGVTRYPCKHVAR